MALSEQEQRMLDEIEKALYAEDPSFASTVRKPGIAPNRRVVGIAIGLALVGVVLMLVGLLPAVTIGRFPLVSLVGFLIVFAAGICFLRAPRKDGAVARHPSASTSSSGYGRGRSSQRDRKNPPGDRNSGGGRLSDRFNRRFDG